MSMAVYVQCTYQQQTNSIHFTKFLDLGIQDLSMSISIVHDLIVDTHAKKTNHVLNSSWEWLYTYIWKNTMYIIGLTKCVKGQYKYEIWKTSTRQIIVEFIYNLHSYTYICTYNCIGTYYFEDNPNSVTCIDRSFGFIHQSCRISLNKKILINFVRPTSKYNLWEAFGVLIHFVARKQAMESSKAVMNVEWWIGDWVLVNLEAKLMSR